MISVSLFGSMNCSFNKSYDVQGLLKGYDQATNLILDECHERVYSTKVHLGFLLVFHRFLLLCAETPSTAGRG